MAVSKVQKTNKQYTAITITSKGSKEVTLSLLGRWPQKQTDKQCTAITITIVHRRIKRDLLCHRQLDFTTVIFLNDRPLCFFRQLIKPATDKHCLLPILDLMNYYIPDRQIHGVEFSFMAAFLIKGMHAINNHSQS